MYHHLNCIICIAETQFPSIFLIIPVSHHKVHAWYPTLACFSGACGAMILYSSITLPRKYQNPLA